MRKCITFIFFLILGKSFCQLPIAPDTISVLENGYCLKMPWAGGINAASFSNMDVNFDGKQDIVIYDKLNNSALGAFKCFVNVGNTGQIKYKFDPELTYHFPRTYNWALIQDYNMDGKADLFCSVTGGIQVYKNIGNALAGPQFSLTYSLLYSDYNPGGVPSVANIYTSPVGLPALSDIDNDGDLDILTFSPTGIFIEYHKNKSKELFGHSDSLRFELADQCWGKISENNCVVNMNQCPLRPLYDSLVQKSGNHHAGACLMCLDNDGDGDKDLILGDISCSTIEYCQNDGTIGNAVITDTTKLFPNYPLKGNTVPVKFNAFPCTHYIDVDNDGKKELIGSPNTFGSENATSVWLYKNISTTNTLNLQFVKNNFLQDEMIEAGQMSRPVLIDYNADGKKDLLIGSNGVYINNARRPRLYLYANTGTLSQPSFSLISKDYANLSSVLNGSIISAVPAPGDIDGDGDVDLFVITNGNVLSWYENTAGAGNTCNFSVYKFNHFNINFPSSDAIPQLFDLDKDGKLDLLVGTKNGKVYFYKNTGSIASPSFSLVTNALPNVSLKGDFFVYGIDGYAAPFFYNEGANTKLLGGCVTGQMYYFDVPSVVSNTCTLIDSTANDIIESTFSTPWYEDINGDSKPDLFVGNAGGGVSFYSSKSIYIGVEEMVKVPSQIISVYPNPAENKLFIEMNYSGCAIKKISVTDLSGKTVLSTEGNSANYLDIERLESGVYLVRIQSEFSDGNSYVTVKKFIKK